MFGQLVYIRGTSPFYASHIASGLQRFWDVKPILNPFSIPLWAKTYYAIKTLGPNRSIWSQQYHYESFSYHKTSSSFYKRTRWISQEITRHRQIDAIFQTGSYCLPSLERPSVPYAVYIDFTTRLAEQQYTLWAKFRTERDKQQWIELEGQVYEAADRIFTFIESARWSVIHDYGIPPRKVIKVGTGVILPDVPETDREYDSKTVVFAGRDFKRHGGELVLEAFELAQTEVPQAELVVTGSKFDFHNPRIHTLGSTSYAEVQRILKTATVVVMPGKVGGLQTLTEAMAHRCVCIADRGNPHLSDLILDGITGFYTPPDPVKLAEKIVFVLRNPDLQHKIGKLASEHVRRHFTWPVVTEKISREMATLL